MAYNKIILQGNLTRDIELRYSQSGSPIASTGIATTRKFKSQSGEQKEETLFVDLTFFGRSAEIANQYLRKGSSVLIDGRLKLDQWKRDGQKRSKHSVIVENMQMLGSKEGGNTQNNTQQSHQPQNAPQPRPEYQKAETSAQNGSQRDFPIVEEMGEEIPF